MTETTFDHDRLDVYRLAVEYAAESFLVAKGLSGLHRHARDQWLRAAQSIPLNIAEGNGKRSLNDRARFLDIARGSALECAAIQDVLAASGGPAAGPDRAMKGRLHRIVAMLTRMAMRADAVAETPAGYGAGIDSEHEHRCAEHEGGREPEPADGVGETPAGYGVGIDNEHQHRCAEHEGGREPEPADAGEPPTRSRAGAEPGRRA
jgi:four helix bundle protein